LAHVKENIGTYYGKVYNSTFNGLPFFTVSRRITHDGAFAGVLELSVLPSNFFRFYSTLAYTEGLQYGLIREDGTFLARYPLAPTGAIDRLDENSNFRRTVIANKNGGSYTSLSPIDGIERRFAVQRFGNTALFFTAGISSTTIRSEWIAGLAPHLIFGIPATLVMFLTLFTVLRRTTNLNQRSIGELPPRTPCANRRSWRRLATSPVAWRTISTISSRSLSAISRRRSGNWNPGLMVRK
jgi:two-component system, NtrC family, sensor kinase